MGNKKAKGEHKPANEFDIQIESSMDIRSTRFDEEPGVA